MCATRRRVGIGILAASLLVVSAFARPNVVIFIADDLGIGDVGCFGNTTLRTPNIDSIAQQGATLDHHLAAASVCTPSRAALLTGRYPVRSGMASPGRNRVFLFVASKGGLPRNETTFAKVLQSHGYKTALVGKWHLGSVEGHKPRDHGFDHFYGLPLTNLKDFGDDGASVVTSFYPKFYYYLWTVAAIGMTVALTRRKAHSCWMLLLISVVPTLFIALFVSNLKMLNSILMRDLQVVEQPIRLLELTTRFVQEAKEFIAEQAANHRPFLLVFAFHHVHSALYPSPPFAGSSLHGKYGDCVHELDWGVGEILSTLNDLRLRENTFVYFTSDNGGHIEEYSPHGVREGGYNGIFKGGKAMGAVEGGIRVPTVAMWPGKIPAGLHVSVPTSQLDMFPTIMHVAGLQLPDDRIIDGKTLLPLLTGQSSQSPHQFLFHYCGSYLQAVRYIPNDDISNVWKMYFSTPNWIPGTDRCHFVCQCYGDYVLKHDPPLLYNIEQDPSESHPMNPSSDPRYAKIHAMVLKAVKNHKSSLQPVPQQMNFKHAVWLPWLQPCCNFPHCNCIDEKYSGKIGL